MIRFYYFISILLICLSLYHFITARNFFKGLISVNILGSGVFLFFVTTAKNTQTGEVDPVPHALVLTGVVVAVSATALAVSLILHLGGEKD